MAERKLQVLLKKIMANGDIDHIFFKSRAKDVMVDESGTQTLADIATKVNKSAAGATKVEDSSTNGNIKINGVEKNVYEHPTSGVTAGTYNSVTVNAQGHVTSASKVTEWTGTVSGNIGNGTNTIKQATSRANLTSGEKLSTSLGKIKKYFADLGSMAFTSSVGTSNLDSTLTTFYNAAITTNNVTESTSITAAGWVADARAIASLQKQINTINNNLTADGVSAVEFVDARSADYDMNTIFTSGAHHRLYRTNTDTLNTPYKAGVTDTYNSSYILSVTTSTTYGAQYAYIMGSRYTFIRRLNDGVIGDWNRVLTDADMTTALNKTTVGTWIADATALKTLNDLIETKQAAITGGASTITSSNLTTNRALISNGNGKVAVSAVTSTELGYLDGVTSAIQTQLNGKQATITGGITTALTTNFSASRAIVSNADGKLQSSAVTSTELGYLDGVTSAIQTQLNGKAPKSHATNATTYGGATATNYGHVKLSDTYTSSGGAASASVGASSKALYDAYTALNGKFSDYLPLSGGTMKGSILADSHMEYDIGSTTAQLNKMNSRYFNTHDKFGNLVGQLYMGQSGTAKTDTAAAQSGYAYLKLGNDIAAGTNGNSKGRIDVYDDTKYRSRIQTVGDFTADRIFYLPNVTGTALCSSSGNLNMATTFTTANTDYTKFLLRGISAGTTTPTMANGNIFVKY